MSGSPRRMATESWRQLKIALAQNVISDLISIGLNYRSTKEAASGAASRGVHGLSANANRGGGLDLYPSHSDDRGRHVPCGRRVRDRRARE
jgi:hypothetical protein